MHARTRIFRLFDVLRAAVRATGHVARARARCARPLRYAAIALLAGCAAQQPPVVLVAPPAPAPAVPAEPPAAVALPVPVPSISTGSPAAPPGASNSPAAPTTPAAPGDKVAALQTWVAQQSVLYRVAAPLLIHNTELCPRHVRNLLGFTAKTKYSYGDEFIEAAERGLGLANRLAVIDVLPGSGAAQAGLQKGDVLLAVEIEPLPQGPNAERDSATVIGTEIQGRDHVSLTVLRDGQRQSLDIPLTSACAMVIELGDTDSAGSYADGQRVMVTRGMLNLVTSDRELAYVLAHEIARNALAPQRRPDVAAIIDRWQTLRDGEGPQASTDRDAALGVRTDRDEARIDELSLYMLARAGYDFDGAADFWSRLASQATSDTQSGIDAFSGQRAAHMADVAKAITTKMQNGEALLP